MTRILHISADYPDAFSARKTLAIRNLVEGSPEFQHRVYAINRQNGFGGIQEVIGAANITTLVYHAPPYAFFLETYLSRVADWIASDVLRRNIKIDLIHAHKLTIEGLVALRLSRLLKCPFICTIRGNTDQRYLRIKRDKRASFRKVVEASSHLLPITPWCDRYVGSQFDLDAIPRTVLPTISGIERVISPDTTGRRLVTVFHLDHWKMKGMPRLLAALAMLKSQGSIFELDIIGGGAEDAIRALHKKIKHGGLQDQVRLVGPVEHDILPETLNAYAGFVLPTLRETFGMVYVEALFAGVPILYSKDRGIDGYFDGAGVGVRCDPRSTSSIGKGLIRLISSNLEMKRQLASFQIGGGLNRFRTKAICSNYSDIVMGIL